MNYMNRITLPSRFRLPDQIGRSLDNVTEESLEWFLKSPEFESWVSTDDSSHLWLHGLPGSGKSTVATYVRRVLSESESDSREKDIASIFCSREKDIETEIKMVWSLASQLSCRIDRASAKHNELALPDITRASFGDELARDLWRLLEQIILLLPEDEAVFILDGIDEIPADTRSQFLLSLHHLERNLRGKAIVRILISSSDYPDIREALNHYPSIERGKEWKSRDP